MQSVYKLINEIKAGITAVLHQNDSTAYLTALAVIAAGILVLFIAKIVSKRLLNHPYLVHHTRISRKLLQRAFQRLLKFLYVIPLFLAVNALKIPPSLHRILEIIFYFTFLVLGVHLASALVALFLNLMLSRNPKVSPASGKAIMPIANFLLWIIALTFFLDNLGFQVSTIIAGLGIMGVAVGLAGQAILADFFSYMVIIVDKPFQIGDYITVNSAGLSGTVERIGLKTTHLRSPNGERIIGNNSEMVRGFVSNFYDVRQRRVTLLLPLKFDLSAAKIDELTAKLKTLVTSHENCNLVRAVLLDFGTWCMNFEFVYNINIADMSEAMAVRHEINLQVIEYLESEGIGMAVAPAPAATR